MKFTDLVLTATISMDDKDDREYLLGWFEEWCSDGTEWGYGDEALAEKCRERFEQNLEKFIDPEITFVMKFSKNQRYIRDIGRNIFWVAINTWVTKCIEYIEDFTGEVDDSKFLLADFEKNGKRTVVYITGRITFEPEYTNFDGTKYGLGKLLDD